MLNIEEGISKSAVKVCLYGLEGIGKTTCASKAPNPLFLDTEGGTIRQNVRRIRIKDWTSLLETVKEIIADPTICKTVVVDTADWAEIYCDKYVCDKYRKANIEEFPYGKGYTYLAEEFNNLLILLDKCIEVGLNVIVLGHAKPRKFELPDEMGQFDRYEMKLSKQVAPLLKEWVDALLFANYKTYVVVGENNAKKATGGKRVLYTSHHPCWDAKNRFDLPSELDLDFTAISEIFNQNDVKTEVKVPEVKPDRPTIIKLRSLIKEADITEEDLIKVADMKGHHTKEHDITSYSDDFITRWIIPNWTKIIAVAKEIKLKEKNNG